MTDVLVPPLADALGETKHRLVERYSETEIEMWDATATMLAVHAWPDRLVDALGFPPTSAYVEWAWLPILGPSATWAWRCLATGLGESPDGYQIDIRELTASSGVGAAAARTSSTFRTTERLIVFRLARWEDNATLAVRRKVPPLPGERQHSRSLWSSAMPPWRNNAA